MPDKEPPQLSWDRTPSGNVVIRISGHWLIEHGLIGDETMTDMLADVAPGGSIVLDAQNLLGWDSSLIEFLTRGVRMSEARGIAIDRSGTPEDVKRLIGLAFAVPDHPDRHKMPVAPPPLARIGGRFLVNVALGIRMLGFFGESVLAFGRLLRGASAMREIGRA